MFMLFHPILRDDGLRKRLIMRNPVHTSDSEGVRGIIETTQGVRMNAE